jgi:hypothetical protein
MLEVVGHWLQIFPCGIGAVGFKIPEQSEITAIESMPWPESLCLSRKIFRARSLTIDAPDKGPTALVRLFFGS